MNARIAADFCLGEPLWIGTQLFARRLVKQLPMRNTAAQQLSGRFESQQEPISVLVNALKTRMRLTA